MALSKTIQLQGKQLVQTELVTIDNGSGIVSFDAYIKVESLFANKKQAFATVTFSNDKGSFEKQYDFDVDLEGPNFIKQAYLYLKTLPEFEGAVDC